jgi:hypothetical protein
MEAWAHFTSFNRLLTRSAGAFFYALVYRHSHFTFMHASGTGDDLLTDVERDLKEIEDGLPQKRTEAETRCDAHFLPFHLQKEDDLHTLLLARLPSDEKADISYIGMGEYLHKTGNTFGNCVENTGGGRHLPAVPARAFPERSPWRSF